MDLDAALEDLETSELEKKFNAAAAYLPSIVANLDSKDLLEFYGLFKQSTVGPCNVSKPGIFSVQARQKWTAWHDLGQLAGDLAMQRYVDKLDGIDSDWSRSAGATTSDGQKRPSWVSVSTLQSMDVEAGPSTEPTTLIEHVKRENIDAILAFFSSSLSMNQTDEEKEEAINEYDDEGLAAVHWAADHGFAQILEILLNHGADVNRKDQQSGQTALHYAISCGHGDCVQVLLKHGGNPTICDADGSTCFDLAADDASIMKLLRT